MSYGLLQTLSDRIVATQQAFNFIMNQNIHGPWAACNLIMPMLMPISSDLRHLHGQSATIASDEMNSLIAQAIEYLDNLSASNNNIVFATVQAMTSLVALRPALDSLIGFTVRVHGLVERAFAHLQRLIVVDDEIGDKWRAAFDRRRGEEKCEQMGATHLLLHGIWAFKVDAKGEKTDLVLKEPLEVNDGLRRAATSLVLTEWKKVRSPKELNKKIKEAKEQAGLYAGGCLAGFELESTRFLVMVSNERIAMPEDIQEGNITYRCINLAVRPNDPSVEARKASRSDRGS